MTVYPKVGGHSPWGPIQSVEPVDDQIAFVGTAGHGGMWVHEDLWKQMPKQFRETDFSRGGWFEEDCDWCLPVLCFPSRFTDFNVTGARVLAKRYHKAAYRWFQGRQTCASRK